MDRFLSTWYQARLAILFKALFLLKTYFILSYQVLKEVAVFYQAGSDTDILGVKFLCNQMKKGNLSNWTLETEVMDDKSEGKNKTVKQNLCQFPDISDCYIVKQEIPSLNGSPTFRTRLRKQSTPLRFIRSTEVVEVQPSKPDKGKRKLYE